MHKESNRVREEELEEYENEENYDDEPTVEYEAGEQNDLEKSAEELSEAETELVDLKDEDKILKDVIVKNVAEEETSEPQGCEEVDDVEEYVPEEDEMKGVLEERIFGGLLPKAPRRLKPPRKGVSERTGRGGRNETNTGAPETVVLGAVNYMLGNTVRALNC